MERRQKGIDKKLFEAYSAHIQEELDKANSLPEEDN
jgi:hypothetical protein